MTEQNEFIVICINGHQIRDAEAKFCIFCRAPLNRPDAQTPSTTPPIVQQPEQPISSVTPPSDVQTQSPTQMSQTLTPQTPPQPSQAQSTPVVQTPQQPQQPFQPYTQNPPPDYYPQQQNYYPQQQYGNQQYKQQYPPPPKCQQCGDNGKLLDEKIIICPECGWLRPLTEGYDVDCSAFQWSEDGKAMSALRKIKPLSLLAESISEKVGRRWIETTFNGVLLSEKQLPGIYAQAVRAARVLAMPNMPDIYVSGELAWDCRTYGTNKDSFIVLGSALATNFRGPEILFLFAREMGHCRTGHALWKTVIRFLLGEQGPRKGIMAGGLFAALSPTALLEGALEMPLLAWARQAEITADRAGLLAIGDEETARRVLLSWSLKSPLLYRQINVAAWLEQQDASEDEMSKLSEVTTTATPYIARRLRLMTEFARSPELERWRNRIIKYAGPLIPAPPPAASGQKKPSATAKQGANAPKKGSTPANGEVRLKCTFCKTSMRVPSKVLQGKEQINVRCPNAKCGKIVTIKKKPAAPTTTSAEKEKPAITPNIQERNINYDNE